MTILLNKNSFCRIRRLPPLCIKTNLRENRFFALERAVGEKKVSHKVKKCTEN